MSPIGDIAILAGVLLLVLSPGARGVPTRLLVVSALLRIASDLGSSFIPDLRVEERLGHLLSGYTGPAKIRLTSNQRDHLQEHYSV